MLDLARRLNEEHPNLVFHLNQQPDLGLFPPDHFDFVYSRIVLQHMAPEYAMRYITEFVRVVRPGGLVAFQIPSRPGDDGAAVSDLLRPSGVFRAEVAVPAPLPELVVGGTHRIDVHVANASSTTWAGVDGSGPDPDLSVGNHWLDPGDNVVQMDDGRAVLPVRLAPGERVVVPLTVRAPDVPGSYLLEIDLVKEHVAWFRDKGSIPCAVPVTVVASKPPPAWKRLRSEWRARRDRPRAGDAVAHRRRNAVETAVRDARHRTVRGPRSRRVGRRECQRGAGGRSRRGTGRVTSTSSRSEHDLGSWRRDEDGIGTASRFAEGELRPPFDVLRRAHEFARHEELERTIGHARTDPLALRLDDHASASGHIGW